jgi:hypothetical protein
LEVLLGIAGRAKAAMALAFLPGPATAAMGSLWQ